MHCKSFRDVQISYPLCKDESLIWLKDAPAKLQIYFLEEEFTLTRIYLIRHGETEWNHTGRLQGNSNVLLSPEGIHQAWLLAEHTPFRNVDAIYSSDLSRAIMTAEPLAEKFGLPIIQERGFREMNFGEWEGRALSELALSEPGFERFFTKPDKIHPPGGETFLEGQARVLTAMDELVDLHDGQSVIVVSHGAIIRLILCAALTIPIRKMWAISQSNSAVNILCIDGGSAVVELVNSTAHLYKF